MSEKPRAKSKELEIWKKPSRRKTDKKLGEKAIMFGDFVPMEHAVSIYENMRGELEKRVVDQPHAIDAIIEALERSHVRGEDEEGTVANLAFLGPTGVGKSEMAKVLAELLGDGDVNLIKIDCSNYSHGHEVASLTGAPLGFRDSERTPLLGAANVQKGKGISVVLFDEIEKGSQELYNLLLQIMADGELRMNNGGVTSFKKVIVILTSNLGAKEMKTKISKPFGFGNDKREVKKEELEKTAKKSFEDFFSPEFYNRLDKLIVFHNLSPEGLRGVLDTKLEKVNDGYKKRLGAIVSLSDATRDFLVDIAVQEPHLGARPLVRALRDHVHTPFGRYVGSGRVPEGTHVRVFHVSEAPEGYIHTGDSPLIFTSKSDPTIKKWPTNLLELTAKYDLDEEDMDFAVNEEDFYHVHDEPSEYDYDYDDDDDDIPDEPKDLDS